VLEHPVLGVDPSTRRVAVACVFPDARFEVRTISFGTAAGAERLALARAALVPWLAQLYVRWEPGWLFVEQPFAKAKHVHPASQHMLGVVQEAAYVALGLPANLVDPTQWKKAAGLGGFAKKRQILEWARGQGLEAWCEWCAEDGSCKGSVAHDQADALGVARAGVVLLSGGLSAARGTVKG
jgi:Holliday junction resolvasome RuvABC endonuclease subunit